MKLLGYIVFALGAIATVTALACGFGAIWIPAPSELQRNVESTAILAFFVALFSVPLGALVISEAS